MKTVSKHYTHLFILVALLTSCSKSIPVIDFDYKNRIEKMSCVTQNDTTWFWGGYYSKAISKKRHWDLFRGVEIDYSYKHIPNEYMYYSTDSSLFVKPTQGDDFIKLNIKDPLIIKYKRFYRPELNVALNRIVQINDTAYIFGVETIDSLSNYSDKRYHGTIWKSVSPPHWQKLNIPAPWVACNNTTGFKIFRLKNTLYITSTTCKRDTTTIWTSKNIYQWKELNNFHRSQVISFFEHNNNVYAVLYKDAYRLFRFNNNGDKTALNSFDSKCYASYNSRLFTIYDNGLYVSENNGNTWSELFVLSTLHDNLSVENNKLCLVLTYKDRSAKLYSTDGVNWQDIFGSSISFDKAFTDTTRLLSDASYGEDDNYELITWKNKEYLIHGQFGALYSTNDGINWDSLAYKENKTFPPRSNFSLFAFDNKIWISGGIQKIKIQSGDFENAYYVELNDLWFSTDAVNWEQWKYPAPWQRHTKGQGAAFNNKLYYSSGNFNETYITNDCVNWGKIDMNIANNHSVHCRPGYQTFIPWDNYLILMDKYTSNDYFIFKEEKLIGVGEMNYMQKPSLNNLVELTTSDSKKILLAKDYGNYSVSSNLNEWQEVNVLCIKGNPENIKSSDTKLAVLNNIPFVVYLNDMRISSSLIAIDTVADN